MAFSVNSTKFSSAFAAVLTATEVIVKLKIAVFYFEHSPKFIDLAKRATDLLNLLHWQFDQIEVQHSQISFAQKL